MKTLVLLPNVMEHWKEVPHLSRYEVSTSGNVRIKKSQKCMTKHRTTKGYEQITLWDSGKYLTFTVHRLVATTFLPNPEQKETINHINRVKYDNRVDNLEWATRGENMRHAHSTKYVDQYSTTSFIPSTNDCEQWRYLSTYKCHVSDKGCVKVNGKILRVTKLSSGYCLVTIDQKLKSVHRLVAEAYLSNFSKDLVVNHIDSNPSNNCVENLECVTQSRNILHAYATGSLVKKKKLSVIQVDYLCNIVGSYESLVAAQGSTGFSRGGISDAIRDGVSYGRYRWFSCYEDYVKAKDTIYRSIMKVFQYNMDGSLLAVYDSYVEAEQSTGIDKEAIARAVQKDRIKMYTAGGFLWATTRNPKAQYLEQLRNQ